MTQPGTQSVARKPVSPIARKRQLGWLLLLFAAAGVIVVMITWGPFLNRIQASAATNAGLARLQIKTPLEAELLRLLMTANNRVDSAYQLLSLVLLLLPVGVVLAISFIQGVAFLVSAKEQQQTEARYHEALSDLKRYTPFKPPKGGTVPPPQGLPTS
jgi:hypothetical protein